MFNLNLNASYIYNIRVRLIKDLEFDTITTYLNEFHVTRFLSFENEMVI